MKTAAIIALIAPACLLGQSFETASLRRAEPEGSNRQSEVQVSSGSLVARGMTLRSLIQWAWDVPPLVISGPSLIDEEHFDVAARTEHPVSAGEVRLMLRHLLGERIALQTHVEKKEKRVYALTVAPNGPKFEESKTEGPAEFTRSIVAGKTALVVRRATMAELAAALEKKLNELIVDETGLKGHYDLNIDITTYAGETGDLSIAYNDVLSIMFSSLPAQTGLKLDSRRLPIELLIVDHVGSPQEN